MNVPKIGTAFLAGLVFAVGLGISGMCDTTKVIGFLTLGEHWNPALMLVMGGAIAVHFVFVHFINKRQAPLLDSTFYIPTRTDLNGRLVVGAVLFGLGWGLGGVCPGPGIVSVPTGNSEIIIFVVSMLFGAACWQQVERKL